LVRIQVPQPIDGVRHITTLLAVLQEISGRPQATVFGRGLRLGLLDAPLANGQMGHVLDYDDTHMGGVVLHTSSPVLAALFALAERATDHTGRYLFTASYGVSAWGPDADWRGRYLI
jgi:2-methylcitrate dehydratase PrpD